MTYKTAGRIVGALFLYAILANIVGSELLDSIVTGPDYLTESFPSRVSVVLGGLLEMTVAAAVIGIPVIAYPFLKKYGPTLALGYLGFRLVEAAVTIPIVLSAYTIFSLSEAYVLGGALDTVTYQLTGTLLQEARTWALMLYILLYMFGAVLFYTLMYKSKLIPRVLSVWGFVGLAVTLVGTLLDMFLTNSLPPEIYGITMGLQEICMGLWLLARGFRPSTSTPLVERTVPSTAL